MGMRKYYSLTGGLLSVSESCMSLQEREAHKGRPECGQGLNAFGRTGGELSWGGFCFGTEGERYSLNRYREWTLPKRRRRTVLGIRPFGTGVATALRTCWKPISTVDFQSVGLWLTARAAGPSGDRKSATVHSRYRSLGSGYGCSNASTTLDHADPAPVPGKVTMAACWAVLERSLNSGVMVGTPVRANGAWQPKAGVIRSNDCERLLVPSNQFHGKPGGVGGGGGFLGGVGGDRSCIFRNTVWNTI